MDERVIKGIKDRAAEPGNYMSGWDILVEGWDKAEIVERLSGVTLTGNVEADVNTCIKFLSKEINETYNVYKDCDYGNEDY